MSEASGRAVDIWLPDLARFAPDHPVRGLLRKADRVTEGARGYLAGLRARFDATDPLPAGALTRQLLVGDAGHDHWLSADPAWVQPDLNGARLLACGRMQLSPEDAHALADALKPLFAETGMALEGSSPDHWHVRLPAQTAVPDFAAPEQALGEDLYYHLPQGEQGRRWRILLNEVQVVLHQHPVNAERRQRGVAPVNHLWLWGAGVLPGAVRTSLKHIVGDDVLLHALASQARIPVAARSTQAVSSAQPGALVDLQDLPVDDIATQWTPSLLELSRRHPVELGFASGERWLHRPWHRLRFWKGSAR